MLQKRGLVELADNILIPDDIPRCIPHGNNLVIGQAHPQNQECLHHGFKISQSHLGSNPVPLEVIR